MLFIIITMKKVLEPPLIMESAPDRYKLIHFYDIVDSWELYDLETDPNEMKNLYNDPACEPIVIKLRDKLRDLQNLYLDQGAEL